MRTDPAYINAGSRLDERERYRMTTRRDSTGWRLRPLAAALALAVAPSLLPAATAFRPGDLEGEGGTAREDGQLLRTALGAWHLDARANSAPASTTATRRFVTNCDDDGDGSLRAVVAASASGDTIDLGALTCATISLETGAIAVRLESATIVGPATHALAIDGNRADRVFLHYGYGSFTLRDLTVQNGLRRSTGFHLAIGGCIASAGYLTLDHSTVTGCEAIGEGAYGGAIYAYSLLMASSTLSNNTSVGQHLDADTGSWGGAAFVYQIDMVDSTVTGNRARHAFNPRRTYYDIGGGIATIHGGLVIDSTIDSNYAYGRGGGLATLDSLLVRNSTVSGNTGERTGGGGLFIRFPAQLDARNSTVANNTGHNGGGILFTARTASLQSTIVAGNAADDPTAADMAGTRTLAVTGANNLIGAISQTITLPADTLRGDPGLLPLTYNGGPTRTHALIAGSAAVNAGNNTSGLDADQRGGGFARVVGGVADIGAFELNPGAGDGIARVAVPAVSRWTAAWMWACLALLGVGALRRRKSNRH
jgi:hypothetical protein